MKATWISLASLAVLLTACEDLENLCGITEENLSYAEDYNTHMGAALYVFQQTDRALRDSALNNDGTGLVDGAICTLTSDSLIIDYGLGTVCDDGNIRSGQIRASKYANPYLGVGGGASVSLTNYTENDRPYSGTASISTTSGGANPTQNVNFQQISGAGYSLSGSLSASWLSGFDTGSDDMDDAVSLGGELNLTDLTTQDFYTATISNPLQVVTACPYTLEGGFISLTPSNAELPAVSLDFLDGDCANLFQVFVDCEGNQLSFSFPIK